MLSTVLNRSVNQSHKPSVFISWLFVFKVTVLLKKSIFNCCCLAGCLISQIRSCVKEEEGSHTAGLTYSKLLNAPQMWYFQPICIFIRWCPLVSEVDYLLSKVFVSLTSYVVESDEEKVCHDYIWNLEPCSVQSVFLFPWEMLNVLMCKITYVAHLVPHLMRHILIETWKNSQFYCLYTRVLTFCIMFLSIKYIVLEIRTNPFTTEYDLREVLSIVHWQSRSKPLEQFSVGKHSSCET